MVSLRHRARVAQSATGGHDVFVNNGTTDVGAKAFVSASTGDAFAYARGYAAKGIAANLDVTNAGSISVAASATAPDTVRLLRSALPGSGRNDRRYNSCPVGNSVGDGGRTAVTCTSLRAPAAAEPDTTATTGGGVATVNLSQAATTGIAINSGINNLNVTNTGTISVDAITTNGAPALAYGIRVLGSGGGVAPTADDVYAADQQFGRHHRSSVD